LYFTISCFDIRIGGENLDLIRSFSQSNFTQEIAVLIFIKFVIIEAFAANSSLLIFEVPMVVRADILDNWIH
jgi:hypothetical protein